MDTPESLLVPLRRKLDGKPKPANLATIPAAEAAPAAAVADADAKPSPEGKPVPAAPIPAAAAKPAAKPAAKLPLPTPRTQGGDRFIVEGENGGRGGRPQMAENSTGDNRATLAPAPAVPPAAAAAGSYFVQVASFSSKARADELAKRIGAKTVASADGKLFRVRYGPYPDANAAQQGVTLARRKGYQGVQIQQDSGR